LVTKTSCRGRGRDGMVMSWSKHWTIEESSVELVLSPCGHLKWEWVGCGLSFIFFTVKGPRSRAYNKPSIDVCFLDRRLVIRPRSMYWPRSRSIYESQSRAYFTPRLRVFRTYFWTRSCQKSWRRFIESPRAQKLPPDGGIES